jgi:protein ImuA
MKSNIIARLKQDILPLQGITVRAGNNDKIKCLGQINSAFPNHQFPLGAVHEFISETDEEAASTSGFLAPVLASIMNKNGVCIWISKSRILFPPALKFFGVAPEKIFFINIKKDNDLTWAMEEALKCSTVTTVVGEIRDLSFTASRRLQLAVEESRATGFLLRNKPKKSGVTACVTRWRISPVPSDVIEDLPGLGFPKWKVELLKVRNGKPGKWIVQYHHGRYHFEYQNESVIHQLERRTG